jgi:hypothetical protein
MNWNQEFLFVAALIIALIFFSMIFGKKALYMLLWLILAGQVVVNWRIINDTLKEVVQSV